MKKIGFYLYYLFYLYYSNNNSLILYISGGWNNNPTAVHFKAAFRHLISHVGADACGTSGNVQSKDNTEFLHAATATYVPPTLQRDEYEVDDNLDEEFFPNNKSLDLLVENVLVYIAGYVVRKALRRITCDECRAAMVSVPQDMLSTHIMLNLRNNGGLCVPSNGVIEIVKLSEKHLRKLTELDKANANFMSMTLQGKVLQDVAHKELFDLESHYIETRVGIDSHFFYVVRIVVDIFYTLRQHHIVRLQNMKRKAASVRHKMTKSILFMGQ